MPKPNAPEMNLKKLEALVEIQQELIKKGVFEDAAKVASKGKDALVEWLRPHLAAKDAHLISDVADNVINYRETMREASAAIGRPLSRDEVVDRETLRFRLEKEGALPSPAAEAASRIGKAGLRAIGPIAAVQDVVGYAANQTDAEAKLTGLIGKDGVPKLSKEAVTEYGEIVAKLKIEQGVTFGLSEAIGFSSFMDWAKKNELPLEAVEKLNPTSKTKAQIEEALNLRGGQMAQAGTAEVVLAQAPDVRQQDGRNIG